MKRTFIIPLLLLLLCSEVNLNAQSESDSTYQGSELLPPTSKSRKGEAATKYSTPPPSTRKSDWKKKIYVGGYFGLGFGTYTYVDISPIVGYNFTKDFNMGVGVIFNYFSQEYYTSPVTTQKLSSTNWGGRINATYTLFNLVSLGAEYQYISVEQYNLSNSGELVSSKVPVNILFLGAGLRQRIGNNASIFVMLYYDVIQDRNSPYYNNNGLVWRIGVAAGF